MSDPITAAAIGAAISGGTSLAKGKSFGSSLQNAAIGAALGGGGSYLGGLFGGAGAAGGTAGGATSGTTSGTTGGTGLLSGFQGVATTPASLGTGGFASGIGGQAIPNVATNLGTNVATTASSVADDIVTQGAPNIGDDLTLAKQRMSGYEYGKPFSPDETIQSLNQRASIAKAPNFDPVRGTPVESTKGGYDLAANKPLYEKAYDSVVNYAQKNPLDVLGVGLVASGQFGRKTPAPAPETGSVNKGTPPQTGQMLQVRRPTRFSQG